MTVIGHSLMLVPGSGPVVPNLRGYEDPLGIIRSFDEPDYSGECTYCKHIMWFLLIPEPAQCIPGKPLYKEPGIRSVYGFSLWNHFLPAIG